MRIRDRKTRKPKSLLELNMKPGGCPILTMKTEGAFLVK
jgi:hypothetical protein